MMKQMTIKKKITLWYTGIIALILGMVLGFMFYFVDKVGISATEEEVSTAVTGFSSNFQFQDGTYYLSEDTKFYEDGVMFCVYDDNGKLLYGTMPEKFPKQTMLKSHTPRVIKSGSSKWMVYDSVYTYGQNKEKTITFPEQCFDPVTSSSTEKKQCIFVVRIKLKLKAYDRCQSIDPTTEIRKSHRQIHLFKPGSICIIQHG